MDQVKAKLKEIGNPFEILGLDENISHGKKEIKAVYKQLVLIHHPDKTSAPDAKEIFHKIKEAYKLLSDPDDYKRIKEMRVSIVESKKKVDEMNKVQRQHYDDLLKREHAAKLREEELAKDAMKELAKKQEKLKKEQQLYEEEQKAREHQKQEKLKLQASNAEFHSQANSIKLNWSKLEKVSYNQRMLEAQFRTYGPIKTIVVVPEKKKAVIEFMTATAAEAAVKDYKTQNGQDNSDNSDEDTTIQGQLKVKFLLKSKKRAAMISMLEKKNQDLKQPKDLSLSSDNLSKIANLLSRSQGITNIQNNGLGDKSKEVVAQEARKAAIKSSVSDLRRQHDRKKFIEECCQDED